jgi:hypothetical protein
MNKTWHSRVAPEIKRDLLKVQNILENSKEQNVESLFTNDTSDKLLFFAYHTLQRDNYNKNDLRMIHEISDKYFEYLKNKRKIIETKLETEPQNTQNGKKIIEDLTNEFFDEEENNLYEEQNDIIKPIINSLIMQRAISNDEATKDIIIQDFLKMVGNNISEEDFNDLYDYISNKKNIENIQNKIKRAKDKNVKKSDFENKEDLFNKKHDYLMKLSEEILTVEDIRFISKYLFKTTNREKVVSYIDKEYAIRRLIIKWAYNLSENKTKMGTKPLSKFLAKLNKFSLAKSSEVKLNNELDEETKRIGLNYANELNGISDVVNEYFDIKLNKSGIKYRELLKTRDNNKLLRFVDNIRKNLKSQLREIASNSNYNTYDDIFSDLYSLLHVDDDIKINKQEIFIIKYVSENLIATEIETQEALLNEITPILQKSHKHITEAKLTNMEDEYLIKKIHPDVDLNKLDYEFTKNKLIPIIIGERNKQTNEHEYLDMTDELSANVYRNYTKSTINYHRNFGPKDVEYYKNAFKYLFSLRKSQYNNALRTKTKERESGTVKRKKPQEFDINEIIRRGYNFR